MEACKKQIYDDVAGDYDVIWGTPAVRILWTLLDTHLQRLGPWTNTSVLDLACGTGIGLREARKLGASKLVGVDISPEMIDVCRSTTKDVDQFSLHVADCSQPLDSLGIQNESFDLVIGMWLLNYAENSSQMAGFWGNVARYLKPGAKFVGIIQNQETIHPSSMKTLKYGAKETGITPLENGEGWRMHVEFETQPKVEFDTFVLKKEILEGEAKGAGMKIIEYIRPGRDALSGADEKDEAWWQELLDEYPNQLIVAAKA